MRSTLVIVLLVAVVGTIGTAVFLYNRSNFQEQTWDRYHMATAMFDSGDYENALKELAPVIEAGRSFEGLRRLIYCWRTQEKKGSNDYLVTATLSAGISQI